jgi:hypothetical protein
MRERERMLRGEPYNSRDDKQFTDCGGTAGASYLACCR